MDSSLIEFSDCIDRPFSASPGKFCDQYSSSGAYCDNLYVKNGRRDSMIRVLFKKQIYLHLEIENLLIDSR